MTRQQIVISVGVACALIVFLLVQRTKITSSHICSSQGCACCCSQQPETKERTQLQ
jgi:preprotein translocase subunit SecG